MPARSLPILSLAALACACVSPPEDASDGVSPVIEARAEAAEDAGYPDLSAMPTPGTRPSPAEIAADAAALEAEAAALRALREEARRGADAADLAERGAALRAAVARDRAVIADAPEIAVPDDLRR